MKKRNLIKLILTLTFLLVFIFLYAPISGLAAPKEIRIGASIPKSGPLSAFGLYEEWGFTTVVKKVNEAGGVYLSKMGKKLPVKLILYDDESRPEKSAENMERLILRDEIHAALAQLPHLW